MFSREELIELVIIFVLQPCKREENPVKKDDMRQPEEKYKRYIKQDNSKDKEH